MVYHDQILSTFFFWIAFPNHPQSVQSTFEHFQEWIPSWNSNKWFCFELDRPGGSESPIQLEACWLGKHQGFFESRGGQGGLQTNLSGWALTALTKGVQIWPRCGLSTCWAQFNFHTTCPWWSSIHSKGWVALLSPIRSMLLCDELPVKWEGENSSTDGELFWVPIWRPHTTQNTGVCT